MKFDYELVDIIPSDIVKQFIKYIFMELKWKQVVQCI